MCGICGIYTIKKDIPVEYALLEKMCQALIHRGPDDQGIYIDDSFAIGMRRLSIIDVEGGHQPMHNEDKSIWVVYNGEIYNFKELKETLKSYGHQFATNCDTEVIVHAYEQFGISFVEHFNGMFSFALCDKKKDQIIIVRDRMGIKPLFYYHDSKRLVFASEIKSILQDTTVPTEIDYGAIDQYFSFKYIRPPRTIYMHIRAVLPGTMLIFSCSGKRMVAYWDIPQVSTNTIYSETVYQEKLLEILTNAVKKRLISDVPLGAFLSGGIDSSTVVGLMSKEGRIPVKTFSFGFDDKSYNELPYARIVSKKFNTQHKEFVLKPDIEDTLLHIIRYLDQPLADSSIIPTYLISRATREHVKVALSGDGGDELFAGYDHYKADRLNVLCNKVPYALKKSIWSIITSLKPSKNKKGMINMLQRFIEGTLHQPSLQHMRWMKYIFDEDKYRLYTPEFIQRINREHPDQDLFELFQRLKGKDRLAAQLYIDLKVWLPHDILIKVDLMSMANSLEVRVPFLDHEFVEFVATIPSSLKMKKFQAKYILKNAMRNILPDEIISRNDKQGFSIPVNQWLRTSLKNMLLDTLTKNNIESTHYFNHKYIQQLINEHIKGTRNHGHILWALLVFFLWFSDK